ncbi:patatin-like phospholipase family protein [Glaciimonas sp. Gout2]|uniref:patatin-like phospholipase family protein n=1 Tax=unclassified Glaciimonas TaxID=2644401 RepID=UPI002AB54DDA|nr:MULTISPECIES: patatin-like phospholipase family protein [unclassified Glaciimonas]MDY7548488.1 patatin-like phospholipase family protein [Glaciimonas sp. CA11.2]MEB0010364.1 patatin-like phospholipase family protein [Glaciimonas sp. Cout2]MEB0084853.1 patatin-like phospholipase family protein [Glaciimonas sp. Gout2]
MQNKTVTLALQGGGSHGAFTWGVLDRLLEDGRVEIEGVSGASAGAMNAVVMSHGFAVGGRDGARQALSDFWDSVSTNDLFTFMPHHALSDRAIARQASSTAVMKGFFSMMRLFSPYQFNPFDLNPLRDILVKQIDFDRLRSHGTIKLFVAATQVSSGTLKIFRNHDLSLDALLASACLPSMHHAIKIDGEAYWDGGLTANPPIFPLLHLCTSPDIMVVLLHPFRRPKTPTTSDEIGQRLTEISFSSAFFTELGGIALARRNIEDDPEASGKLEQRLKNLNMHLIDADDLMSHLSVSSKLNIKASFINALRDAGRQQAGIWLAGKFDDLGRRSSFDIDQFLP